MVYTWSFTAATPSFHCRPSFDNTSKFTNTTDVLHRYIPNESQCRQYQSQISITECQRCFQITNKSDSNNQDNEHMKACTSFIFDRTYYQSTLVEEVLQL